MDATPHTATARRIAPRILAACLLAAAVAAPPARAEEIQENEALVMRLVFEDCLGFVRQGRTTRTTPARGARPVRA